MTDAREKIIASLVDDHTWFDCNNEHEFDVSGFLTALSEAGWVVVPKRPTMEMEEAGGKELPPHKGVSTNGHHASHIYRAMISAATPPVKGGE